jgi:hypothetical protein
VLGGGGQVLSIVFIAVTHAVTEDLRGMLEDHCNLDQFVTWMRLVADELVEQGAMPAPEKLSESIYRAQTFLFCWAQYTSLIMCDLTCRDAPSLGAFLLLLFRYYSFI